MCVSAHCNEGMRWLDVIFLVYGITETRLDDEFAHVAIGTQPCSRSQSNCEIEFSSFTPDCGKPAPPGDRCIRIVALRNTFCSAQFLEQSVHLMESVVFGGFVDVGGEKDKNANVGMSTIQETVFDRMAAGHVVPDGMLLSDHGRACGCGEKRAD